MILAVGGAEAPRAPARRRVLVIAKKTGQLGNRLLPAAHAIAAARELGWQLWDPAFLEYARFFDGTRAALLRFDDDPHDDAAAASESLRDMLYPLTRLVYEMSKTLQRLSGDRLRVVRTRRTRRIELAELMPTVPERCRVLFLQGLYFRAEPWVVRHGAFLRRFFLPVLRYRIAAERCVDALRQSARHVVGVHIRHGDYRGYLGGRYFYPLDRYVAIMRRVRELLGGDAAFLICSNAPHDPATFAAFRHGFGPGHMVEDLHALSLCDYVLGPPSTFSLWAAFHGRTRLYHVTDPAWDFALDDFRLVPGLVYR